MNCFTMNLILKFFEFFTMNLAVKNFRIFFTMNFLSKMSDIDYDEKLKKKLFSQKHTLKSDQKVLGEINLKKKVPPLGVSQTRKKNITKMFSHFLVLFFPIFFSLQKNFCLTFSCFFSNLFLASKKIFCLTF